LHLLNHNRSVVNGQVSTAVSLDQEPHNRPAASTPDSAGERSGSRAQLDPSFRRITQVGTHQSSLRRSGSLLRPDRVA
jgi:hypothetical protein